VPPTQVSEAHSQRQGYQNQKDFSRTALRFFVIVKQVVEIA
jgi:hypothetical protein